MMDWTRAFLISALLLILTYFTETTARTTALATRDNFSPHHPNNYWGHNNRQLTMECDGEENFKSDIGIVSYILSLISSTAGLFSLVELSVPSNNISIISTVISLIFWVPSAILTYFAWSDPISWATGNLVNVGSLIITLYGGLGIFTGTADILVSTMDEVLGITALILGTLTTFPETFDDLKEAVQGFLGREVVNDFLRGYGCGYIQPDLGFGTGKELMVLEKWR